MPSKIDRTTSPAGVQVRTLRSLTVLLGLTALLATSPGPQRAYAEELFGSVRPPALAGTWYAADPEELARDLDRMLDTSETVAVPGRIVGLIAPHAGYRFSGLAAAAGFKLLKGHPASRVIILAPAHYAFFQGVSILPASHFETPLGKVPLDQEAVRTLLEEKLFTANASAHVREHAIEIELPFLQRVLGDFKLVPILVGELEDEELAAVAESIRPLVTADTLVIASSDFTHYGAGFGYTPFSPDRDQLRALDFGAIEPIVNRDWDGFLAYRRQTSITVCGYRPIAILLQLLPAQTLASVVDYYTSGDVTGEFTTSVSYASIVFTTDDEYLDAAEQRTLLALARATLERHVRSGEVPSLEAFDPLLTPRLRRNQGVFVTLFKEGQLRGCIGYIAADKPLCQAVAENTVNAASRDPRFAPVEESELDQIDIEISVLSAVKPVASPEEVVVGRDGLIVSHGARRGLLLPSVPLKFGWDKATFLEGTCLKAGLPADAWRKGAELSTFTAQVFHE